MNPERVTLTDEEREALADALTVPTALDPWAWIDEVAPTVERILAAREQALREEIAGEIEAYAPRSQGDGVLRGLAYAARIARGGVR